MAAGCSPETARRRLARGALLLEVADLALGPCAFPRHPNLTSRSPADIGRVNPCGLIAHGLSPGFRIRPCAIRPHGFSLSSQAYR